MLGHNIGATHPRTPTEAPASIDPIALRTRSISNSYQNEIC